MDKFDRIFQLHAILSQRRTPIPLEERMAKLECSKSTLHRTINTLKNHLNASVVLDTEWVADEQWHPQQEGTWLLDGSYELRIPYREARELVMDVMRHGAAVKVTGPVDLRREIGDQLATGGGTVHLRHICAHSRRLELHFGDRRALHKAQYK